MTDTKSHNDAPKAAEAAIAAVKAAADVPVAAVKTAATIAKTAAKPTRRTASRTGARTGARKPRAAKAAPARKAKTTARKAVRAATDTNRQTLNQGTRIMKNETSKIADRAQAVFGDVNARAKTAIERNNRIAEEMTDLGKGNVEAMAASTKVAAKGVEKIGQEVAEYSRKSFEEASAAIRGFAQVKSPTDLFRLQGDFARTQFDAMIAESSRMSETMIKLAGDMFEPLTSRYSVAAERVKSAVAR
jgi:phasin family protein